MPILKWNVYDLVGCLAVEPVVEEYEVQHNFEVRKDGAVLKLALWQYESAVHLSLFLESSTEPLIGMVLLVRDEIIVKEDGNREWVELRDCVIGSSRFSSYREMGNVFDRERYPFGHHVRIRISPQIQVEFLRSAD